MRSTILRAAFLALALSGLAACASSRTLGGSVSDLETNASLKSVLFADRKHDYGDVDLTVYEGRVMLTGTMRTEEGHKKLVEDAWKAEGVKQVIDEVIVADKTSFGQGFEDARIDQTLRTKLVADNDVTSRNYKIAVSRGVVYLLGVARDEKELDKTLAAARSIAGVEAVVSHVVYQTLPGQPG
jgi:osmotically-inducible protein OsmY